MLTYVIRRIGVAIPMIWLGLTLTFFIMRLAPGDPTTQYINPDFDPEVKELMLKKFGLDKPLHVQYWRWLTSFVQGDFGISFDRSRPVADVIEDAIYNTLILNGLALMVALLIGVVLGIFSAIKQYSKSDDVMTIVSLFFYSMPRFWLGLMLILIFSYVLGWLPTGGMTSINYEYMSAWGQFWDRVVHLILPVFVLGVASAASTMRYMRGSMLETIRQDFIRTARAKGLSERVVNFKHATRNAILPVVTLFGLSIPFIFSGSIITEIVFAWPGMGRVMLTAIFARDYPVAIAVVAIIYIMVTLGNLLADILYAAVDPRVRYGDGGGGE
ncbi:MAG: ABC transporter permease [Candidatus Marinimicrobia bacterium]|nr:ABC transporter permease [Candidatus Neomarinimicrobiota bacterium]MCF7880588.1 ABC transporter permease [Candidatus Neomarinimicrobiota bacterium]